MQDEPYEAPMKPFGGVESFAWSPDSKQLIYVSRKKTGMEYALSTNSDLYLYDLESKTTKNITEGMMGYDTNPVYSPDGKYVAWLSMEHDGYESDKNRIFVMDCATVKRPTLQLIGITLSMPYRGLPIAASYISSLAVTVLSPCSL